MLEKLVGGFGDFYTVWGLVGRRRVIVEEAGAAAAADAVLV